MEISKQKILTAAGFIVVGLFLGWLLFSGTAGQDVHPDHDQLSQQEMDRHVQEAHTDDEGDIVYTCSMHPQIRENEPGDCPICGMELIPVSADAADVEEDVYSMVMTEAAVNLAQIQTTPVIRRIPEKELDLPGRIQVDERRTSSVTTHFPGRIIESKVNFTGSPIRKGEPMASIYSPELISAQRELIEAARQKERNPRLYESTRQKFRLWEFTDEQIDEIESRGEVQRELEILSPVDGYVLSRNIADQQYVNEGTVIYEVADLDRVWVVLEAYEEDIDWIQPGNTITFSPRNGSSQNREATVTYIDPIVDPQTRTVGIRADVDNPGHRLKPDMLIRGVLRARMDSEELMVPASSVLWTGPRSLVYVKDEQADVLRFEVREVELGARAGDFYVIEEGLSAGEEVVFNGAFRIDSEMQLADRFSMMNREPGTGHGAPSMPGMDMDMDDDEMDVDMEMDGGEMEMEDQAHEVEDLSDQVPEDFKREFTGLIDIYLDLKDALVASDFEQSSVHGAEMMEKLESIGEHRLEGAAGAAWMETWNNLHHHIQELSDGADLEEARFEFQFLSGQLTEAVKSFGIEGVVYHQYCPMEEASWLSSEEQIANPYMEDMPSCGEIVEQIE